MVIDEITVDVLFQMLGSANGWTVRHASFFVVQNVVLNVTIITYCHIVSFAVSLYVL